MVFRGIDWIDVAQDRERWPAVVNVAMERLGSINCEGFVDYMRTGLFLRKGCAP